MQNSRDSSVWRTLAVAFGDGRAFGAGITLKRNPDQLAAPGSMTPDLRPLNDLLSEIEQRIEHARAVGKLPVAGAALNHRAADAVVKAIDERFTEIGGEMDRRLAELEVKVKVELGALDAQDHALAASVETRLDGLRGEIGEAVARERHAIDGDMRTLRAQMAVIHKEFAETLARLVDEQIARTVATRLRAMEGQLRQTVREEARLSGQDRQIARLRERLESQEGKLQSLVTALGQGCRQAAGRVPPA